VLLMFKIANFCRDFREQTYRTRMFAMDSRLRGNDMKKRAHGPPIGVEGRLIAPLRKRKGKNPYTHNQTMLSPLQHR
jgi:hypothetical protein